MDEIKLFCFDLDNTLYSEEVGLLKEIRKRIVTYVQNTMSIEADEALTVMWNWKQKYNSTLQGLIQEFHIDEYHYLKYIHNINLDDYLEPDNQLKEILNLIEEKKIVVTDSYSDYAHKVIEKLGISNCFDACYCTENMEFFNKKQLKYLKKIIQESCQELGIENINYDEIVLIDDSYDSLCIARELGLRTAYISSQGIKKFDYNASNVIDLLRQYYLGGKKIEEYEKFNR